MYANTKLLRKKKLLRIKNYSVGSIVQKGDTGVNPSGTCQLLNEKNGSWRRIVGITLILTIRSLISSALTAWKYLKNQSCYKCLLFSMLKSPSSFIFSSCVRCSSPLINGVTLYQAYSNISMFLAGGSPDFSTLEITFNQCWAEGKDLSPKPIGNTCPNVSRIMQPTCCFLLVLLRCSGLSGLAAVLNRNLSSLLAMRTLVLFCNCRSWGGAETFLTVPEVTN